MGSLCSVVKGCIFNLCGSGCRIQVSCFKERGHRSWRRCYNWSNWPQRGSWSLRLQRGHRLPNCGPGRSTRSLGSILISRCIVAVYRKHSRTARTAERVCLCKSFFRTVCTESQVLSRCLRLVRGLRGSHMADLYSPLPKTWLVPHWGWGGRSHCVAVSYHLWIPWVAAERPSQLTRTVGVLHWRLSCCHKSFAPLSCEPHDCLESNFQCL